MGIDYDSKLIYGWEIDYETIHDYLIANQVGTCGGFYVKDPTTGIVKIVKDDPNLPPPPPAKEKDKYCWPEQEAYQCICACDCLKNKDFLPPGIHIIYSNPHYDCGQEGAIYYVSLVGDEDVTLQQLNAISPETIEQARALAVQFGAEDDELRLFSVPHIW